MQGQFRAYLQPRGRSLSAGSNLFVAPEYNTLISEVAFCPFGRGSMTGRVASEGQVVHIADIASDEEYSIPQTVTLENIRTMLGVPSTAQGGGGQIRINLGRQRVQPFTDRQIELVTTFADQAVIAIQNVRLFDEVQARTRELAQSVEELRALGEVGQAVNSTLDQKTCWTPSSPRRCSCRAPTPGRSTCSTNRRQEFRLRATYGLDAEMIAAIRSRRIGVGQTVVGMAAAQRKPLQVPDMLQRRPPRKCWTSSCAPASARLLVVPLLAGRAHRRRAGGAAQAGRRVPAIEHVDLLQTFAAQSVLAIQNARLFHEIEDKSRAARDRQPAQVAVPRQHEPRAAHAAQRHPRLHRADPGRHLRRDARQDARGARAGAERTASTCSA